MLVSTAVVLHRGAWSRGAAGVAVAGYRQVAAEYAGRRVAIVLCGANIGLAKLKGIL